MHCTFAAGEVVDLCEQDPNTVASLLKLYLRELPEPLIPHTSLTGRTETISSVCVCMCVHVCVCHSVCEALSSCCAALSTDEQIEVLHEIVDDLPTPNRLLLSWLLQHMQHIITKV